MSWLTRRSSKGKSNRDARGSFPPSPPSQSPPPRHDQAAKPSDSRLQVPLHDPRWTSGHAQGSPAQQQAASRATSSRETADANDSTHHSLTARNTKAKAEQDDRKGEGVTKRAEQQGGDAGKEGADGRGQPRSIWERKAAKVSGRDGDDGFGERTPLPPWLRDP